MRTILDGTGQGYEAKVTKYNRLAVASVSEELSIEATRLGENYNLNTGDITLTSGNESAVAYIRNNEAKDFIIEEVLIILGASTGGSGDLQVELVRNPTTGTIVDNATSFDIKSNRNFGSSRPFDGDCYKGLEGYTITDGESFADTTRSAASTVVSFDADVMVLPKGSSIGVNVTPQSGNTSMSVKVAFVGYLFE